MTELVEKRAGFGELILLKLAREIAMDIRPVEEILEMKRNLTSIYARHNSAGKSFEQLTQDMERDNFMSAEQAVAYGLADAVIKNR